MKLLFSKENFSEQFKALLGFVDADMRFNRLKSSIEIATSEMIDLIGQSVYDSFFNESEPGEIHQMAKYAIALQAYRIYAPTADLAVTNNGRLMRRDEHNVSAFQWQIEENDKALANLYYRHLDRLLKYMNEHNITIHLQKYDHSKLIIPNLKTFESFFNINESHYLYLKLIPAIRDFEASEIKPRVRDLYQDKNTLVSRGIWYHIQSACVDYAMSWGLRRLNIQLFPNGVLQTSKAISQGENKKRGDKLEYLELAMLFEKDYEKKLKKIEEEIARIHKENKSVQKGNADLDLGFCVGDGFVDL